MYQKTKWKVNVATIITFNCHLIAYYYENQVVLSLEFANI